MVERNPNATLSKGRKSWCVIFRHPVCLAPDQKQKRRVRRGLGTDDRTKAQALVDQLNQILGNETLWNLSSRERASQMFDKRIVAAFYDPMLPMSHDHWAIREGSIPLPGGKENSDGYKRVLFVGTTGAGKTTIVRQLLGTDPVKDRFPSTSAAKTTTCDIEIVFAEGSFKSVVSFIPREMVQQYIAECVLAAVDAKLEGSPDRDVKRRFLEHSQQRFRLSYLLGNQTQLEKSGTLELEDEDLDEEPRVKEQPEISEKEKEDLLNSLEAYFSAIDELAEKARNERIQIADRERIKLDDMSKEEQIVLQELTEDWLVVNGDFLELVDSILDDVESRFGFLTDGKITTGRDGWPVKWEYNSKQRTNFIRLVNRFSGNHAPSFGRLLTPLVEGIRVAGPFRPEWGNGDIPRIVIMDGQGIGHTADSTSSISTSITKRFQLADAIILADNAAQPLQAASGAVLQSLVTSGHESKLIMAFTHFDEVKGDNLPNIRAKKDHVIGSFENAIHTIGKEFGREAELAFRCLIPDRLVFLSNIQKEVPDTAKATREQLGQLLETITSSGIPDEPREFKPRYDVSNLAFSIQKATQEFQGKWKGILGLRSVSGVRKEHWARVKALARRLGLWNKDEYADLKPVADLIKSLQNHISRFLSNPYDWLSATPAKDSQERIESIDAIKKEVFKRLHDLSRRRILEDHVRAWGSAYGHRGQGSTRIRAKEIGTIYLEAAPIPNEIPDPDTREFFNEIKKLVADSITATGGKLRGWEHEN